GPGHHSPRRRLPARRVHAPAPPPSGERRRRADGGEGVRHLAAHLDGPLPAHLRAAPAPQAGDRPERRGGPRAGTGDRRRLGGRHRVLDAPLLAGEPPLALGLHRPRRRHPRPACHPGGRGRRRPAL
ncbi:MAG: hypothetical protein AVDCRST_MAG10-1422, partial [uncultured Acidimicrobiales bacterium]